MPRAAFCSQCGTNVWVQDDGSCHQGHGPEFLSGFYEVDDPLTAAPDPETPEPAAVWHTAPPAGDTPVPGSEGVPAPKNKTLLIVLIVLGVLMLCVLGSCCAAIPMYRSITEVTTEFPDVIEEEFAEEAPIEEDFGVSADMLAEELRADAVRMVEHFYPLFKLDALVITELPKTRLDPATLHMIASYENNPRFRITFFAQRVRDEAEYSLPEGQSYMDEAAGVVWFHPQTSDNGLAAAFGPNGQLTEPMLDQIAEDFTSVHTGLLVTEVSELTDVGFTFGGVSVDDLDAWFDDFTTYESVWALDMAANPPVWREVDFRE